MQYINGQSARRINQIDGTRGHLYETRYPCTILDTDLGLVRCLKYVYRNPVRAGVIRSLADYEHSSYCYYAFGREMDVSLTPHGVYLGWGSTDRERQEYFRSLMARASTPLEEAQIRVGLRKPFYGTDEFVERMRSRWRHRLRHR